MIRPFDEPTSDAEAEDLRRFLEQGAEVSLETIERFEAEPAILRVPEPAVMRFTVGDLGAVLEQTEGSDVLISLEVSEEGLTPDLALSLFLNMPEADATTSIRDRGFLGSVAFFCHTEERDGIFVCIAHADAPARYSIPLTDGLEGTDLGNDPTLTIVPVPLLGEATRQSLQLSAAIEVVASSVAPSG
jgi:hypothetical protein